MAAALAPVPVPAGAAEAIPTETQGVQCHRQANLDPGGKQVHQQPDDASGFLIPQITTVPLEEVQQLRTKFPEELNHFLNAS